MVKKLILLVLIIFFFMGWSSDPAKNTPVCVVTGDQRNSGVIADGLGGVIILWQDSRNGSDSDIYAQRLNSEGKPLWRHNGKAVCTAAGDQRYPAMVSDGAGGAIFTWRDERNEKYDDIYLQRINRSGKKTWNNTGVRIINSDGRRRYPGIVSDGKGGAIITWEGAGGKIYAQRFGPTGKRLWKPNGVQVCAMEDGHKVPEIIADGFGGAVIAWTHVVYSYFSLSDLAIYIQRVDSSGQILWGKNGKTVIKNEEGTYFDAYSCIELVPDGTGGAFIDYCKEDDDANVRFDNSIQRVDSKGITAWKRPGIKVVPQDRYNPIIKTDGSGGFFAIWNYEGVVYAQRVNSAGEKLLAKNGKAVTTGGYTSRCLNVIPDGSGGAVLALYYSVIKAIYSQRINASGEVQWQADGVAVSTADFYKSVVRLADDGFGGIVFAWSAWEGDDLGDFYTKDIYAHHICANGQTGACGQPVAMIDADRFGGIAPAVIHFDGSGSFVAGGTIVDWEWDFGDGSKAGEEAVSHTYQIPGHYTVSLRVKGDDSNWSDKAEEEVRIFSPGSLDVKIEFDSQRVKANGKGLVLITAACYEKTAGRNKKPYLFSGIPSIANNSLTSLPGNTVTIDLGLTFKTTSGTLQDEVTFDPSTGYYFQGLRSGAAGTAKVSAVVDGYVLATGTVEFTWPKPPVNLQVELKENRSLFMGEYHAHLSWAENPDEVFTPEKYRVYRSTNGGAFELVGEVDASTFTYVDSSLPAGNQYSYAVSMVDSEDDESLRAISPGSHYEKF